MKQCERNRECGVVQEGALEQIPEASEGESHGDEGRSLPGREEAASARALRWELV